MTTPHFNAGLRFGVNATQIQGDDMAGFNKLGVIGGAQVLYLFNDNWDAGFEMLFSQKGSRLGSDSGNYQHGSWYKLNLDYLEVPVYLQYKINKKISFHGGLAVSVLIDSYWEPLYGGTGTADFIRRTEFSFLAGGQYRFADRWSLFARYSQSILGIGENNTIAGQVIYGAGLYNIVTSLGLRYSFRDKE